MTPRDTAIFRDLWLFRYLTTQQVSRLHFGHVKLTQRRLRVLTQKGLVDRFRPQEAAQAGFTAWWYRLARSGARVVAEDNNLPVEAILPPVRRPRTMAFLAHHALVTEFRIWLREACKAEEGFGYRFIPSYEEVREGERRQRRIALTIPGHRRLLIPDGAFTLDRGQRHALFFLEVDRGTEPLTGKHPSAITRKLAMYREAFDSHAAEDRCSQLFNADFNGFRVLCLVPDERRLKGFLRIAERQDLSPLVWVATTSLVDTLGDLSAAAWAVDLEGTLHALTE